MIQEKDFLYRVPVKTAPITTPKGQIRNPEILVDIEGGEFMHGNILDANSTNKLINQSVKEAVDNKVIEGGYVTKDLLDAETSARTNGDEDLSAKIKAEQTRAEGKEKEISDKLAIIDGDSNTEGSFRKAIADVIAAAPEDLDTLKEIADKLSDNDDLHTALNQAITEKADASALANYVLTTVLNQQVDTLNAAIDTKQPKGNYLTEHQSLEEYAKKVELPTVPTKTSQLTNDSNFITATDVDDDSYRLQKSLKFGGQQTNYVTIGSDGVVLNAAGNFHLSGLGLQGGATGSRYQIGTDGIELREMANAIKINPGSISSIVNDMTNLFLIDSSGIVIGDINDPNVKISSEGIKFADKTDKDIPTADGTFINVNDLASADDVSSLRAGLSKKQNKITVNTVDITDIETADVTKLRTIVTNLINALSSSDLINTTVGVE